MACNVNGATGVAGICDVAGNYVFNSFRALSLSPFHIHIQSPH